MQHGSPSRIDHAWLFSVASPGHVTYPLYAEREGDSVSLDIVQLVTLVPALRRLVSILAEKDYRRLEDEGLIAEPVVGPLWRQDGVAARTTPAEIEEVLARVGDRVASRTPLTWDQASCEVRIMPTAVAVV